MINKITLVAASVAVVLGLAGCTQSGNSSQTQVEAPVSALTSGIDLQNLDLSVRPQDDFYRFVDGNWLKRTEIPADKSNYGSFTQLADDAQVKLRRIIDRTAAMKDAKAGSDEQKLGDFYNSFMDEQKVEALGFSPLKAELDKVAAATGHDDINRLFAHLTRIGVKTPFGWYVNNDAKEATQYIVYVAQSGLGLPDRDQYFKDSEKFNAIRSGYVNYITEVLTLIGYKDPAAAAKRIMALETQMADAHWTRVERRDPVKSYNKMSAEQVNELMGEFDWFRYANQVGLKNAEQLVVSQPSYLSALGKLFKDTDVSVWRDYMSFHLINDHAAYLSKAFVDARFNFYSKQLRGLEQQSPRWKRGVDLAGSVVGEILGKLYVKENFPPEAKSRMETMVNNLIKAYGKRIEGLDWMTDETKKAAKAKLAKFTYKIGYPDKWKDYSDLAIKSDDLIGNLIRYSQWAIDEQTARLGGPIDKTLWFMTPQRVNAYYNPVMNEIVFPAAILQPPFFNMAADDAVNYGGIGAVIGHELGHGFDDSGAQFDGDGNLRNWWSDADKSAFDERKALFVEQFNQFKPFDDANVNGKLTLGENIGDLGGLTVAFEAYKMSLNGKPSPTIDGYTGEQRFFLGWGQVWRRKYREEELRQRLMTDSHSPSEYRVNGIVWNMPEFYQAFDVKEGDKLYLPEDKRVKIW